MSPATATRATYRVQADQIECCNCPPACACQFTGTPNNGFCNFLIGFHIRKGSFDRVSLDGVRFVLAIKYPGAIHEGNGQVTLFVDKGASATQTEAVAHILSGQHGGMPWEALAGTIAKFEGPIPATIEMKIDGTRSSFRIPDILEVTQTPLTDVVSGAEKDVHIVYPKGGFFWNDGSVCTTSVMQVNHAGISFQHPGGFASTAIANWSNE